MIQNNDNQNLNQNDGFIHCRASDITRILRTPMDQKNLAKELSRLNYRKCHCQPRPHFSKIFIFEDDKNLIVILELFKIKQICLYFSFFHNIIFLTSYIIFKIKIIEKKSKFLD